VVLVEILQTLNLAQLFADPKTYVDKPTSKAPADVISAFNSSVGPSSSPSYQSVLSFAETNFQGEGRELEPIALTNFDPEPKFLDGVKDNVVKAWSQTVHGYWNSLIRTTNESTLCDGKSCESSLIPLNHTFVVPGGRFREQCKTFFTRHPLISS
jgi:alpha,alpha-trehalase